jgi:WD40 repeat protein
MLRVGRRVSTSGLRAGWCGLEYLRELCCLAGLIVLVILGSGSWSQPQPSAAVITGERPSIFELGFHAADGRLWVNRLSRGVREYDPGTGERLDAWPTKALALADVASAGVDHQTAVVADPRGDLTILRAGMLHVRHRMNDRPAGITDVSVAGDGDAAFAADGGGRIHRWAWNDVGFEHETRQLAGAIDGVRSDRSGERLLLIRGGKEAIVWEWAEARELAAIRVTNHRFTQLCWTRDEQAFMTCDDDGRLACWDAVTGQPRWNIDIEPSPLRALALSPDGMTVATAGFSGMIYLVETASGTRVSGLTSPSRMVRALAFHPTGAMLASGGLDGRVVLWSVADRQPLRELTP